MTTARISREVFLALSAVGWADGDLGSEEAKGILRAAKDAELSDEDTKAIEAATQARIGFDHIDRSRLTGLDRVFVYATAVWLARIDGVVQMEEREVLYQLGEKLNLPDWVRTEASAAAFEVAANVGGERSDGYDFTLLRTNLESRLKSRLQSIGED